MANKAPSKKTDTTDAVDAVETVNTEALISEKMRAGLTRAQAEHVVAAQAEHDRQLTQAAA